MKKPVITIIGSFSLVIVLGTLMLLIPGATTGKKGLPLHDAFFTATSAVTVTGLIVRDTPRDFTLFGQWVLLILIQFGGLGLMTFATFFLLLLKRSINIRDQIIMNTDYASSEYRSIKSLVYPILMITFSFEALGALLFWFHFRGLEGGKRIFVSLFHAVSAFCNAGFSLFSNSFEDYTLHPGINATLVFLIVCGGLGFLVLMDLGERLRKGSPRRLTLHSRVVLTTTLILILTGWAAIFLTGLIAEPGEQRAGERLISSLFQSVTARTAGFNTLPQSVLVRPVLFLTMVLMLIGASPGSTGGGMKTSTAGILYLKIRSRLKSRSDVEAWHRRIPTKTVDQAVIILVFSLAAVFLAFLLILVFEGERFATEHLLFEVISAFGTVGLSAGITAKLGILSKILISLVMFAGRLGPLTLIVAVSRPPGGAGVHQVEEEIMIG